MMLKTYKTSLPENTSQVDEGIKHFNSTTAAFISDSDTYKHGVYK